MELPAINSSRWNLPLEMKWENFEPAAPHFFYCRLGSFSRGTQSLSTELAATKVALENVNCTRAVCITRHGCQKLLFTFDACAVHLSTLHTIGERNEWSEDGARKEIALRSCAGLRWGCDWLQFAPDERNRKLTALFKSTLMTHKNQIEQKFTWWEGNSDSICSTRKKFARYAEKMRSWIKWGILIKLEDKLLCSHNPIK
jgi:hypothetical protein